MLSELRVIRIAVQGASPLCLALIATLNANNANAQFSSPLSSLGAYGRLSTWCGSKPIPRDVTALPSIGCFELSPGRSAVGTISGHRIEVSVDEKGQEVFRADGTVVTELHDRLHRFTNLPYVHTMGVDGYKFCSDASSPSCPSDITVFSRNQDKTILFFVSKCLPPDYRVCVTTQQNWDYEASKRK